MRIAFFHSNNDEIGGADLSLFGLVEACKEDGILCDIYLSKDTSIAELYRQVGLSPRIFKMPRLKRSLNPVVALCWAIRSMRVIFNLRRIFSLDRADLVVGNDFNEVPALLASRIAGIPTICWVRFIFAAPWPIRTFYLRLLLKVSNAIVCVSKDTRDRNFGNFGHSKSIKIAVLYNWNDRSFESNHHTLLPLFTMEQWLATLGLPIKSRVVFMPGRVEPWKGQHVLLDAAIRICEIPDVVIIFAGPMVAGGGKEAYFTKLQNDILEKNLRGRVAFCGFVSNVMQIMREASVVVHASIKPEPFGRTIIEALASGVPLVAAREGGPVEIVGASGSALFHTPGDARDLADKVISVLTDAALAATLSVAALDRAKMFSKEYLWPMHKSLFEKYALRKIGTAP
jgi:glycosyltransferase involved in cell wall biosynthesis